jgi:hypothetical protein
LRRGAPHNVAQQLKRPVSRPKSRAFAIASDEEVEMRAHDNGAPSVRFGAWRAEIEQSASVDQLMRTVRRYLAAWPPEALALLPADLAAPALADSESIHARAYLASRAELALTGREAGYAPLREMALTLASAATRLRGLEATRSLAHIGTDNVGSVLPAGPRGRLEAEVRPEA